MKLLFCPDCKSVFNLSPYGTKSCECGKCVGRYVDNRQAQVNGEGISLAMSTPELLSLVDDVALHGELDNKEDLECWARPHDGEVNPHTSINRELGRIPEWKPL